jgi:hypothetical protein
MTNRDPIEAVMQALQRQQSEASGSEPLPVETIIEAARAFLPRRPMQTVGIESLGRMAANDSLIKARYASTILRVARASDRKTAARLVRAIARDLPLQGELPEIADVHLGAIVSFIELANSLRDAIDPREQPPWQVAVDAAAAWLRAVDSPRQ